MHYIDEGEGDVILFVHGTPSWSFDFRKLILKFRNKYRCIAPDHIGFGLSDKPRNYPYTTELHTSNLQELILYLNLTNITLVVHDFGGPIALHFATIYPERIKQIVIMNSWSWNTENEPEFRKMRRILKSPLLPFLYLYFNFSARYLLPASFGKHKLSKKLHKQYTSPFDTKSERYGTLGFAKSLLTEQEWFQSIWNVLDILQSKRILLIWGMADSFITPRFLKKWMLPFPHAKVIELQGCGHFPQEENSEAVVLAMEKWMNE